jgi:hypothetical protein
MDNLAPKIVALHRDPKHKISIFSNGAQTVFIIFGETTSLKKSAEMTSPEK